MSSSFVGGGRAAPSVRSVVLVVGSLLLLYVVFQAVSMRNDLAAARRTLDRAKLAVQENDTDGANALLDRADGNIRRARSSAGRLPLNVIAKVPILGSPVAAAGDGAEAALRVTAAARIVVDTAKSLPTKGSSAVDGHDMSAFHAGAQRSRQALARADSELARAAEDLDGPSGAWLPPVSSTARSLRAQVVDVRQDLRGANRGLDLLSDLTAPTTDARILILSQDRLELRATGGFIGSFGVLHFDHGTVELERYESFDALPPPNPPMKPPKYLAGALPKFWGISNVNWWPDFPTTAETAKEMFRRQGGGDVAGVIALNEAVMARLVGALGPIQLPGYAKPVTEEGFEDRVVYEVEMKQPQDYPRKKFLIELSKVVFEKVFSLPPDQVGNVAQILDLSVGRGDVQAWFVDPNRQAKLAGTTWSGQLPLARGDFLMLVDSNLQASKSNRDLTREVTYDVDRDGDGFTSNLTIRYRNGGDPNGIAQSAYHGFLRIYVPRAARLAGKNGDVGDLGLATDGPYRVFGTYVDVGAQEEQALRVRYTLPQDAATKSGVYKLTWVRQSGTPEDELVAVLGSSSTVADPSQRRMTVTHDFRGNPIADFFRHRKATRWLFT